MRDDEKQDIELTVTDLDAIKDNATSAVYAFNEQWIPVPSFGLGVEVFDQARLRDAMGLRATFDYGDPWPAAEKELLALGFRWHILGSQRVMFLRERDGYVPDTGWMDAEEVGQDAPEATE